MQVMGRGSWAWAGMCGMVKGDHRINAFADLGKSWGPGAGKKGKSSFSGRGAISG